MAAPPAMSSNHARSPVIKIIAGEDEIFGEENPDLPINVFHVSKSLLLENSKYFAIILDCSPERTTVRLPTSDHEVIADWLDLIYQGALTKSSSGEPMTFEDVERYFKFADLVGSEKLRNTIMDSMQDVPLDHWDLNSLLLLENEHCSSLGGLCDYVLECLAYKIVVGGWAEFIKQDRGGGDVIWRSFISDAANIDLLNRLLLKVDQLNEEKDHNRLVAPSARKDCMWHEHASDDTKTKCPRNASPPWKDMLAYKDIVNGHGTQLEINGHERAGSLFVATA
ncbi:uncharacterized protein Z520_09473 [Fonsecaea multimorphosa CBS 102226]|uniref:BTB domain-containing protein n=1 Tax=Fonsecaea multimorphosa CBS 102226 TaxID=1442371 RepID=A0A0D2KDJ4_9EURO|nr:uncharacterized protein Z520_09473 [Fonsecaea multimorphosa CBS 102226]KIX94783.1 hypothetical protein Z520_09473 [Fonsecaea multimorphosa CBS 102226]OAL20364.1 hypothetical protein AYO22_08858 [Fonsecaea multimorphosa]